jgi:hypothetical protein
LQLGRTYYEREANDADAEVAFTNAARVYPSMPEAEEYHGLIKLARARTAQNRGETQETLKRFSDLLAHADERLNRYRNRPLLRLLRGIALLETDADKGAAESDLRAACQAFEMAGPRGWLAVARFYLGRAQLDSNYPDIAARSFDDAINGVIFPRSPVALYEVHLWRARARRQAGQLEAARQNAIEARGTGSDYPPEVLQEINEIIVQEINEIIASTAQPQILQPTS